MTWVIGPSTWNGLSSPAVATMQAHSNTEGSLDEAEITKFKGLRAP